eukprot:scaffold66739_cov32-Tisochrysis_lutea.AAC.7
MDDGRWEAPGPPGPGVDGASMGEAWGTGGKVLWPLAAPQDLSQQGPRTWHALATRRARGQRESPESRLGLRAPSLPRRKCWDENPSQRNNKTPTNSHPPSTPYARPDVDQVG